MWDKYLENSTAWISRHIQLIMWIKDTVDINCRGKPPDKSKVKKENKISKLRTVVRIQITAVFFFAKESVIKCKLLKPENK